MLNLCYCNNEFYQIKTTNMKESGNNGYLLKRRINNCLVID